MEDESPTEHAASVHKKEFESDIDKTLNTLENSKFDNNCLVNLQEAMDTFGMNTESTLFKLKLKPETEAEDLE